MTLEEYILEKLGETNATGIVQIGIRKALREIIKQEVQRISNAEFAQLVQDELENALNELQQEN